VLDEAAKGGYGVGAFNVNNMEQLQGIVAGAQETQSPVIVQASRGAIAYAGPLYLRNLILAAVESAPEIPIVLHLDHGDKPETCFMAIELGFTSVMLDGSLLADGKTPSEYEYNSPSQGGGGGGARRASGRGRAGTLGGIEDGHGSGSAPDDPTGRLRRQTGVDALAVAIGTSHGAYKFTAKPTGDVLAMHLEEIHRSCRKRTWSCMAPRASAGLVDRINRRRKLVHLRRAVRRSSGASRTACARSTSTPTGASRSPQLCASAEREPLRVRPRLLQACARREKEVAPSATTSAPGAPRLPSSADEMARIYGESVGATGGLGYSHQHDPHAAVDAVQAAQSDGSTARSRRRRTCSTRRS
jgi:fructose/tagatose bisphosphate aldolase